MQRYEACLITIRRLGVAAIDQLEPSLGSTKFSTRLTAYAQSVSEISSFWLRSCLSLNDVHATSEKDSAFIVSMTRFVKLLERSVAELGRLKTSLELEGEARLAADMKRVWRDLLDLYRDLFRSLGSKQNLHAQNVYIRDDLIQNECRHRLLRVQDTRAMSAARRTTALLTLDCIRKLSTNAVEMADLMETKSAH